MQPQAPCRRRAIWRQDALAKAAAEMPALATLPRLSDVVPDAPQPRLWACPVCQKTMKMQGRGCHTRWCK